MTVRSIAHVTWSAGLGGIERLLLDLARAQMAAGCTVSIILGRATGEFLQEFQSCGATVHSLDLAHGLDITPKKIATAAAILEDTDVVNMHTLMPVVALAARRAGTPIVFTNHGNFGQGRVLAVKDHARWLMLRWFLNRQAAFVVFNSEFTREKSRARYGLRNVRQAIVYNGVDFATRDTAGKLPDELSAKLAGKFVVGTCSRFKTGKRVDRLIDAFAEFSQGKEAMLLLVGDGNLRGAYEKRIEDAGIADRTIITGFQPRIVPFQRAMDICVFPSQRESFGLVPIETMSLGIPTLVFEDGGGSAEIVRAVDRENVVATVESLVARLNELYASNAAEREARARRYSSYSQRFSIDRAAREMLEIYEKAVAENRPINA